MPSTYRHQHRQKNVERCACTTPDTSQYFSAIECDASAKSDWNHYFRSCCRRCRGRWCCSNGFVQAILCCSTLRLHSSQCVPLSVTSIVVLFSPFRFSSIYSYSFHYIISECCRYLQCSECASCQVGQVYSLNYWFFVSQRAGINNIYALLSTQQQ